MRLATALAAGLAGLIGLFQPALAATAPASRLAQLPLVEVPAASRGDTLAILYSGDGGWAAIDQGMAQAFARAGVPVVGVNSLRYFWTAQTPQGAASDLAALIDHYTAAWKRPKVILAGYSFGADALPMIVSRLPAQERARIRLMALVGVERQGELEFHPRNWLNLSSSTAYPVAPLLASLGPLPRICVFGADDPHDACSTFAGGLIKPVRLAGGHHFDRDYGPISGAILRQAGL